MADLSLKELLHELAEERGLELRGYKHTTLERRIRRRMFQLKVGSFDSYLKFVRENPTEINDLLNTILINVTEFFRDPQAWQALRKNILPRICQGLHPGDSLRVWSAGCASGEEAYSIAILISEYFGAKLADYDVKIYATDIDDDALTTARHAEYPAKLLRHVPEEWRKKYFTGDKVARVHRDLRRLVIFGKSNLASDAPISHVKLLICRNVLIYFDTVTQERIMRRLHYALDPGGVLFLGRSESQLRSNALFRPIDPKWRFFERVGAASSSQLADEPAAITTDDPATATAKSSEELNLLKLYYNSVLQTLDPGILVLDSRDVLLTDNEAVHRLWDLSSNLNRGKRIADTEFASRCPQLISAIESSKQKASEIRFECSAPENRMVAVTIKPITTGDSGRVGTLVYMEDITPREKLQSTIEALETTTEELQSANEELETTNEELQSTNEELETTNEELQSTNEELETTNEELQSLNEELETTNEELEVRGKELDHLNLRYADTLENLPWPMMLFSRDQNLQIWNSPARKLFGYGPGAGSGLSMNRLPLPKETINALLRRFRSCLIKGNPVTAKSFMLHGSKARGPMDAYFKPIGKEGDHSAVLIMFRPVGKEDPAKPPAAKSRPSKRKSQKTGRSNNRR